MTEHSPGPWRVEGELRRRVIKDANGKTIVVVEHWTTEANALLIASAPSLLASLEEALDTIKELERLNGELADMLEPIKAEC